MTIYRFFFMKKYTDSEQDVNGYSEWVAATTVKEATLFDFFFMSLLQEFWDSVSFVKISRSFCGFASQKWPRKVFW